MIGTRGGWSGAPAFGALSLACIACVLRSTGAAAPIRPTPADLAADGRSAARGASGASLQPSAEDAGIAIPANVGSALEAPADVGATLEAIDGAVDDAMAAHQVPGAVIIVGRHDGVVFRRAYGLRQVEPDRQPMTVDTLFDLASLTKPVATATSLMILVERGLVGLDDPISKYVPECGGAEHAAITPRHLLLHVSGLPADIAVDDFTHGREEAIRRICAARLRAAPGEKYIYSDIGFILLEEIIRRVTSRELPAFAHDAIFAPLGMTSTLFTPPEDRRANAAWTQLVDGVWRVGVVHDPRAFALGGVAGHAGLFSTADDLAVYARALLGGGEVDGKRVLSARSVAAMTAPYDVPDGIRTLGWMVESRWRGSGLSPRAFGHFGFTGTALWIDPEKDLFTVVLTNRVHPDGTGDAKPLVARVDTLAASAFGPAVGRVDACPERPGDVLTGIDVLREEGFARLRGARVGLLTNASGIARDGTSTIDAFLNAPGLTLVALFTPEHGLNADQDSRVAGGFDARTGLPVYSLYGEALEPSAQSLAGIDTLVFDVQDVGTRFYTYGSTMLRAMRVARDHDLRFVVLDRPDPIDGVDVEGPVLNPTARSFVNYHALPVRHGMTLGELAELFDADEHLGLALSVVPMRGWRRDSYGDETGLPWVNPSPNIRSVDEAVLYPAVGLLEGTNVSVGRGTDAPFERVGAPYVDAGALTEALKADALPGVELSPEDFTPTSSHNAGQSCHGVHLVVTDRRRFEPVRTGIAIARELRRSYPTQWDFRHMDGLLAAPEVERAIDAGSPLDAIVGAYREEQEAFEKRRQKYLLYEACPPPPR